jgi:F0F1-type ATP synthase membrane subunit c/vacuolar-type H+-ATPase subunit K
VYFRERGEGLAFLIIAMGIAETVGLFSWVFLFLMLPEMAA